MQGQEDAGMRLEMEQHVTQGLWLWFQGGGADRLSGQHCLLVPLLAWTVAEGQEMAACGADRSLSGKQSFMPVVEVDMKGLLAVAAGTC